MSNRNTYFTAGPAALYPKFEEFLQDFVDQQLGSISHRSQKFKDIYRFTDEQLRTLLNIPAESALMFTGTASEIWERIVLNCTELETFHLVNGSFSKKFSQYAEALGRHIHVFEKPLGEGFSYSEIEVPEYAELICTTQNETSTGVQTREADIHKLKRGNASKLVAVDMVSSAPIPELDLSLVDTAFSRYRNLLACRRVWACGLPMRLVCKRRRKSAKVRALGHIIVCPNFGHKARNTKRPQHRM